MLTSRADEKAVALLRRWSEGDESVQDALFAYLAPHLLHLARQQLSRHGGMLSLESRDLANEASIQLMRLVKRPSDETHLKRLIAKMMRLTCVDLARERLTQKRSGKKVSLSLADGGRHSTVNPPVDMLELNDAIERLFARDALAAEVTELRFFSGLSESEVAEVLAVSRATVTRKWKLARLFLKRALA